MIHSATDLDSAMRRKILESSYRRQAAGLTPEYPQFIYLGFREAMFWRQLCAVHCTIKDARLDPVEEKFMGVRVICVTQLDSHLTIAE